MLKGSEEEGGDYEGETGSVGVYAVAAHVAGVGGVAVD